jgi:hypothetical protein
MGVPMDSLNQTNEPTRMTLDELFRKTFSKLLARLMDTFAISEEPSHSKDDLKDSDS